MTFCTAEKSQATASGLNFASLQADYALENVNRLLNHIELTENEFSEVWAQLFEDEVRESFMVQRALERTVGPDAAYFDAVFSAAVGPLVDHYQEKMERERRGAVSFVRRLAELIESVMRRSAYEDFSAPIYSALKAKIDEVRGAEYLSENYLREQDLV